jgi:hypothetical protein
MKSGHRAAKECREYRRHKLPQNKNHRQEAAKTTNAAAIHLNMIFRTDPNGISKSTTETRWDDDKTGGAAGGALGIGEGGGSCVPYFSIGK